MASEQQQNAQSKEVAMRIGNRRAWGPLILLWLLAAAVARPAENATAMTELPGDTLRDKIRGGLLGQMLGNLNGLPHEMDFIDEPGSIASYVPALPKGAWTDDDTDFEWVYIVTMQDRGQILLPPSDIAQLWKERINKRIWCSNLYARQLMDLGLEPPLTGNVALNPWAEFNISGQFLSETFGLIAPGMPQTAARIGLNYTRVAIDGEPAQTTQMFTSMIATAFLTDDMGKILDAGLAAVDSHSVLHEIVGDVRRWHHEYPHDWRKTRGLLKEKYSHYGGEMRDRNGYELNTGSTIGALLYGDGDLPKTLLTAFNFGWDCDNSAATAGTIVGVIRGYRSMMGQGWDIKDRYANTTRQNMPEDETITSFADRLIELAERVIVEQGGERVAGFRSTYRIKSEPTANVAPLRNLTDEVEKMQTKMKPQIETALRNARSPQDKARAAYLAISLELAEQFRASHPAEWSAALEALEKYPQIAQVLFHHSPVPAAERLQRQAIAAGLQKPNEKRDLW
jgi:hypothetical protein